MRMIKYFMTIYFQMLLVSVSFGQDEKTYRPEGIYTNIDSCAIWIKKDSNTQVFAKYTYDTLGQIIHFSSFNSFKQRQKTESFKYNENGNVIEHFSHDLPDEGAQFSTSETEGWWLKERRSYNRKVLIIYAYDLKNKLLNETKYSASYDTEKLDKTHLSYVCEYFYNNNGCLIQKIEAWPFRKIKKKGAYKIKIDTTNYTCDDRNNQISESGKNFTGNKMLKRYFYNHLNKITKSESFYADSEEPYLDLYEYDTLYNLKRILDIDREGNVDEEHKFYYQDTLLMRYLFKTPRYHETEMSFKYDSIDRIIWSYKKELEGSGYRGGGSSRLYKYKYKYDSKNRLIEEKSYWKPSIFRSYEGKTMYFYNSKNQMVQDKIYNAKNELRNMNVYFYDDKGILHKKIELDADSIFIDAEIYFYDTLGVKIAREMYDEQGFVTLYQTYRYDEEGEEIGGVFYQDGYKEENFEFHYNEDGTSKLIRVTFKKGNKIIKSYDLLYNYYNRL